MTTKRITKDQWIEEALNDPDKDGPCTRLALMHRVGSADEEVHTIELNDKTRKLDAKKIATIFQGKADAFSQDLPGTQTFGLLAFYGNRTEPQARHPFIVHGAHDFGGGATEPPTAQGTTQQGMRLLEAIAQGTFRQVVVNHQASESLIERLMQHNRELMQDNRAQFGMVKDLLVKIAQQENDRRFEFLKWERDNAMREAVLKLAPAAINGLTGNEIFPQGAADTALIERLAEVFDPADPAGSMQKDPMLVGLMMQRMTGILDEKKKRDQKRAELVEAARRTPNELTEGEKDAAE